MNNPYREAPYNMVQLYGPQEAQRVLNRCYEIDGFFGEWVANYVYDILWELPPLSLLDKSIVTVVSLMVLAKEEQLEIHLKGIFNLGKNAHFISQLMHYLKKQDHIAAAEKSFMILEKTLLNFKISSQPTTPALTPREIALINTAALVARGENEKTQIYLRRLIAENILSMDEISGVFRHQMTYCGCPCTMNAFALFKQILIEKNAKESI